MLTSNSLFKGFFFTLLLAATTFAFTSCGDANAAGKTGKEYTSAYVCPMHCKGSGSESPGKCPVCKMDYVKKDGKGKAESGGHDGHDHSGHDHSHDGHDHSGHSH